MSIDINKLTDLKQLTDKLLTSQKRFNQLSLKRREMSMDTHSQKQIQNANANLDWHAMEHDKIVREVHAASVDCGISKPHDSYDEYVEYNPTAFHKYRIKQRIPLCRQ